MPNPQKFNIWRPSKEEQEIMNRFFERATAAEKGKISFVQIDLGELGVYRSELPAESRRQFAFDIVNALCEKGSKGKSSKGRVYANNLLARSLESLRRSSQGGKNKHQQQTTNNQQEDLF